jgi:carboxymethylenebutenolidase
MTMEIQQLMWRIEGLFDAFHTAVYVARDVDAAVALTAEQCSVRNVPTGTGGDTEAEIRRYFAEDVTPNLPADLTFRRISRTADQRRVVSETMVGFTHDRPLPWLLPGVDATDRWAEVLAVSVVSFRHRTSLGTVTSRIASHRTLWDHTGLLAQLGVADRVSAQHSVSDLLQR